MNNRSLETPPRQSRFSPLLHRLYRYTRHLLQASSQAYRIEPVAVLIDGDNISANAIAAILIEAGKYGGVALKRVYANWASPATKPWQEVSAFYGLQQMHQEQTAVGKNAADIALAIDAMELLYRDGIHHFCLVASDSDYTPLVRKLREAGCIVLVIGDAKIHATLQQAATVFVSVEQLKPTSSKIVTSAPNTSNMGEASASQNAKLDELLKRAYLQETQNKRDEWVDIPKFSVALQKLDATFKAKDYGYKSLPDLVKSRDHLFETRKQTTGKTKHIEVRLLTQAE